MSIPTIFEIMFILMFSLMGLFILICLFALPLWWITRLFKFKKKVFSTALIIAGIYFVVVSIITSIPLLTSISILENIFYMIFNYVFSLGAVLLLVKYFYKEKWDKTILVSVIWLVILLLFGFVMRLFVLQIGSVFGNFGT